MSGIECQLPGCRMSKTLVDETAYLEKMRKEEEEELTAL